MTCRLAVAAVSVAVAALAPCAASPALAEPAHSPDAPAAARTGAGSSAVATARFAASLARVGADPGSSPAGVNVPGCTLSAKRRYPVVLVNGTFEVMQDSFGYLGTRVAKAGYCVFGYNYGAASSKDRVQSTGPVTASVTELRHEVDKVRAETGAQRVDLIGYSQGGLLSEYYTKFGGAKHVHSVIALAPTTHGTTLLGIGTLGAKIPGALDALRAGGCAACSDQVVGSAVVSKLDHGRISVPGIHYTVIDTRYEDVVTPTGSSFIHEPGVVNEYVQSFAATDVDEHVILPFNTITGDRVLAALKRAHG